MLRDRRVSGTAGAPGGSPDLATFSWTGGSTFAEDFGDPTTSTEYNLCIYAAGRGTIASAHYAAGATCDDGQPCWHSGIGGFKYRTSNHTPANKRARSFSKLTLQAFPDGRAKMQAKRIGVIFPYQMLPASLPAIAQIKSSDGQCWQASFDEFVSKNDERSFIGSAD